MGSLTPASYDLRINKDGTYSLVIRGVIRLDGLTFEEAIEKIREAEQQKEDF